MNMGRLVTNQQKHHFSLPLLLVVVWFYINMHARIENPEISEFCVSEFFFLKNFHFILSSPFRHRGSFSIFDTTPPPFGTPSNFYSLHPRKISFGITTRKSQ